MNIIIFGASGATGHELVRQALSRGYGVTAFVRNPSKLKIQHQNLSVIQGDIADYQAVERAIKGHQSVLSALGASSPFTYDPIVVDGLSNIVRAMETYRVSRLVYMSFVGVRESRHRAGFIIKYIVPKILASEIKGHEAREIAIRQSQLEWTIVRPPTLTNGKHKAKFKIGEDLASNDLTVTISRADVADCMLQQLTTHTFIRKAPIVMY